MLRAGSHLDSREEIRVVVDDGVQLGDGGERASHVARHVLPHVRGRAPRAVRRRGEARQVGDGARAAPVSAALERFDRRRDLGASRGAAVRLRSLAVVVGGLFGGTAFEPDRTSGRRLLGSCFRPQGRARALRSETRANNAVSTIARERKGARMWDGWRRRGFARAPAQIAGAEPVGARVRRVGVVRDRSRHAVSRGPGFERRDHLLDQRAARARRHFDRWSTPSPAVARVGRRLRERRRCAVPAAIDPWQGSGGARRGGRIAQPMPERRHHAREREVARSAAARP